MILIAESGSTKTDWVFLDETGKTDKHQSPGINPFYQDCDSIYQNIHFLKDIHSVDEIYFYGAGCANEEKNRVVEQALLKVFPHAKCEINSDLLAAARSLCKKEKGIACILGTGSNSCLYNGESIEHNVSPLGFILGDEGSGAVLGKKLMADLLKKQAPEEICKLFFDEYQLEAADIIHRVYREEFPNRFLAQFTKFLSKHIDQKYIYQLVTDSFIEFFQRNIKQYSNCKETPIHFTGSIAFYFQKQLEEAAIKTNLQLGKILQSPLEGLIQFHSQNQK